MNFEVRKLSNGLLIAVQKNPYVKTVAMNVMVKAGSRNESESQNGISHMLEHMAFKGTHTRTAKQIAEEFDNIGGYINAYTSRENTSYHAKVLKEHWKFSLEVLADITINSTFPEDELEKEKGVVLQEILEGQDSPDDLASDLFQEAAYPRQAIGRGILGTSELVESFTRDDLITYMRTHYIPENMAIAFSGNIEIDEVAAEVEKYFRFPQKMFLVNQPTAKYIGGMALKDEDFEQAHLYMGFEMGSYYDDDYYAMQVLSNILGGSMSSRLFQEVREKRGLAYTIGSTVSSFSDTGAFIIHASVGEDKFRELITVIFGELNKLPSSITTEEFDRAKVQLVASLVMYSENANYSVDEAAKCLLTHGRFVSIDEMIEQIDAVTLDRVKELSVKTFASKLTFAATGKLHKTDSIIIPHRLVA